MTNPLSRRDVLKLLGAAGAGSLIPALPAGAGVPGAGAAPRGSVPIVPLTSSSDLILPPPGRTFQKFSFDLPEPSVELDGLRFAFLVFTRENAYAMDASAMTAAATEDGVELSCTRFLWAGGQERAPGTLHARLRRVGGFIEWTVAAEMDQPIKAVTTVVRGIPRGRVSRAGDGWMDPGEDELLLGYPFGAGDLFGGNTADSPSTPLLAVQPSNGEVWFVSSLDDRVRAKRFYLRPGRAEYRLETVFEVEGWEDRTRVEVPAWRVGRIPSLDDAVRLHYAHLEHAYAIPRWDARTDVPAWMRGVSLVMALHGMHYTGYVFNDFDRMREILRWTARRIAAERVLVFLPAWDGRYYWDYPRYVAAERLGGEAGLRRLVREGKAMGFRFMPMFGCNAANRRGAEFARFADAATSRIDGDRFDITWVDWDNDRHQEGWLSYMNLGVDSWRAWMVERIADVIERYGVDAYFLDISGGWMNNPRADMHEGLRRLVLELRARHPQVLPCGEFHYDALLAFIPLFQVWHRQADPYARSFEHLSHPAPGRGSAGVHESGFGAWNPATLAVRQGPITTLTVVDDTFTRWRDEMAAVIAKAQSR